jgi:pilus assembly protein CpaF
LPLLLTLSSGVNGFTTIHAGSARQALSRLRFICQLADTARELPLSALNSLVSEAVDIVVYCTRTGDRMHVSEVVAVEDLQTAVDSASFTVTELFGRSRPEAELCWTGNLPSRATRALEAAGYDALALLDTEGRRRGRGAPEPAAAPAFTLGGEGGRPITRRSASEL